jgi:hypothetical protein
MAADIAPPAGTLQRLLRWVRRGFARSRPGEIMIMPEPMVLVAWRGLLGLPPKDRR